MLTSICADCQYLGDKYSFPQPNNMRDIDMENHIEKHYYCCCGDSPLYTKDIACLNIKECEYFEEI